MIIPTGIGTIKVYFCIDIEYNIDI